MKNTVRMLLVILLMCGMASLGYAQGDVTVVSANNAYAYNPNPPYDVIPLQSGDVIPEGWNVYLADDAAELVLLTETGEEITLTSAGYFDLGGGTETPPETVQDIVEAKAQVLDQINEVADDLADEDVEGDDLEEAGLDVSASTST